MRKIILTTCIILVAALPTQAVEFLGIELCTDSATTAVILPLGSPLTIESVEIGKHGGLVMLLKADDGDVLDHVDDLMAHYTGRRGAGGQKSLQWSGQGITAIAQKVKSGQVALAVSTTDDCQETTAADAAEEDPQPAPDVEAKKSDTGETSTDSVAAVAGGTVTAAAVTDEPPPTAASPPAELPDFEIQGRLKHTSTEAGWVDVMGVVVNNSTTGYKVANFDLSLYDAAGDLICVDAISVSELRGGQDRAFRDSIRCADYTTAEVVTWKLQFAGGH
jgi:hypothetical protein